MAGEKQVSAQDSANAIQAYMTAGGGSGLHYEYAITTSGKKSITKDSSELYLPMAEKEEAKNENTHARRAHDKMISIGHQNQPGYTIMLYPESKHIP